MAVRLNRVFDTFNVPQFVREFLSQNGVNSVESFGSISTAEDRIQDLVLTPASWLVVLWSFGKDIPFSVGGAPPRIILISASLSFQADSVTKTTPCWKCLPNPAHVRRLEQRCSSLEILIGF